MQRKAVRLALPGLAMLTLLAAGCTGGDGDKAGDGDAKSGAKAPAAAPPGKYRMLPMPCKAVDGKRLKAILPAAPTLTDEEKGQLYAGVADTSYDSDRRVGCRWKTEDAGTTRLLFVGFERVVSYDRATTSDDDKAHQVYERQLVGAGLPAAATPTPGGSGAPTGATPGTAAGTSPGTKAPPATGAPTPAASAPGTAPGTTPGSTTAGTPTPGTSTGTAPGATPGTVTPGSRRLDDLAGEAFLDDRLAPAAGATAPQSRTVRIVFRTSNVIVTVDYAVQPTTLGAVPSSEETQELARELADALADRFSD
ncbi:DUF3558 domain-containing protein [Streptomyces sp. NPDC089799]|uniref:DUF3558 domain-containing protein n=1 Tax=Streptomyces sp. NPDC089799 TaxID=3155066 RepID=UPI003427629E